MNQSHPRSRSSGWPASRRRKKDVVLHLADDAVSAAPMWRMKTFRRSRPVRRSNTSWLRSAIGILVFVEIVLLGGHAVRWATTIPRFVLSEVNVVGHQTLNPDSLVKLAGLSPGTNLFGVDLESVRRRVESNPWVRRSSIRKIPPSTLRIEIDERRPAAIIRRKGAIAVDGEGVILGKLSARPAKCLPVLEGFSKRGVQPGESIYGEEFKLALRAASLFEGGPLTRGGCLFIRRSGKGRLWLRAPGGKVSLLVGEEKMEAQAARFLSVARWIFQNRGKAPGPVQLDLTFPGRIIVRPMNIDGGLKG
ncbi:MAG: FtsQ-type POTRA domain-containing protein [bacterium]